MHDPLEALEHAIGHGQMLKGMRRNPGPGQVVANMSAEEREALSRLTSRDLARVRTDVAVLWVEPKDAYGRSLRLAFDRRLFR